MFFITQKAFIYQKVKNQRKPKGVDHNEQVDASN